MPQNNEIHPLLWRQTRPYAEAAIASTLAWPLSRRTISHAIRKLGESRQVHEGYIDSEIDLSHVALDFWQGRQKNIIVVDPALYSMLKETEGRDIPLSAIQYPYDAFYLSFENTYSLNDFQSIRGAYIIANSFDEGLILQLVFHDAHADGSPLWSEYVIEMRQDGANCGDTVGSFISYNQREAWSHVEWSVDAPWRDTAELEANTIDRIAPVLGLIFNVLCYLSTNPFSEVEWSAPPPPKLQAQLTARGKRKRAAARSELARRSILPIRILGRDVARALQRSGCNGIGSVAPHWRRGHFHTYWTGTGRTVPTIKWVRPVIINADQGDPQGIHIHPVETAP